MKNRKELKKYLIEEQQGKCFFCTNDFTDENLIFDHLFPKSLGGENSENNIVLSCYGCGVSRGDKIPFREVEFTYFISQILEKRKDFRNIKQEVLLSKNTHFRGDIFIEQKIDNEWRKVLIELKVSPTFTSSRLNNILSQLSTYKSEIDENVKIVLAFPGILTESDYSLFKQKNIEIWDREFIRKTFKSEIEEIDNKLLQKYFSIKLPSLSIEKKLLNKLSSISAGRSEWSLYQNHIEKILDYLFGETLSPPITERSDNFGINRRDFILRNYNETGFWKYLRETYKADFIVIDAKNYTGKIKKNQILQICNYLKQHGTGLFAIIISRNGEEDKGSYFTRREKWVTENKMVIILDDNDIQKMILAKAFSGLPEEIIKQRIEEFRLDV
jgi:hypothetical protein